MVGRKKARVPADLARAKARMAAWRGKRKAGARIPDALWAVAVKLAAIHGLGRTASCLGLDYYSLKKRVESAERNDGDPPAFIELGPALPAPIECLIELDDGSGATMRIHLKGREAPDVIGLARHFWSAG